MKGRTATPWDDDTAAVLPIGSRQTWLTRFGRFVGEARFRTGMLLTMGLFVAAVAAQLALPTPLTAFLYLLAVMSAAWACSTLIALLAATASITAMAMLPTLRSDPSVALVDLIAPAASLLLALGFIRATRAAYERERDHARLDGLTGALTLRAFHEALRERLAHAARESRSVALIYMDLDHFKQVNDRHGHHAGDRLLRGLVDRLRTSLLPTDIIGRLGGDEFAILLDEVKGPCAIDRFQGIVDESLAALDHVVTASIGALIVEPGTQMSQSEMVILTDSLMYDVKRGGRADVRLDLVGGDEAAGKFAGRSRREVIGPLTKRHSVAA